MTRVEASYILRKFYADDYKSNYYNTLEQALQLAVMCLENFPNWISVKVQKPKLKHLIDITKYSDTVIVTNGKYCTSARWVYSTWGGWYSWYDGDEELKDVTHWMHLPQPPKEGDAL